MFSLYGAVDDGQVKQEEQEERDKEQEETFQRVGHVAQVAIHAEGCRIGRKSS